jgi:repressor LexA
LKFCACRGEKQSEKVGRTSKRKADSADQHEPSPFSTIPLYGKIAAGTPIEAIRHEGPVVLAPPDMVGLQGNHYALTVDGDSMMKAGINNRDTVIIKRCETAENGAIVVALVDEEEVTLKRLRRAGGKIVLEPENDSYLPQILEPERVKIQGRLVGLMRTYPVY